MNIAQALALRGKLNSYEYQENCWLLAHILQCSVGELKWNLDQPLTDEQQLSYQHGLKRLHAGEPLAYILGTQPFWTLDLIVNTETLVPRPDTEILVETALSLPVSHQATCLDLGTGTGAIALALASERPTWKIIATDIAPASLDVAQQNAIKHHLTNVQFYSGSWFQAIEHLEIQFDLIVSNPPYIAEDDLHLMQLTYEPRRALVAQQHGLADLQSIIQSAPKWLKQGGWLLLEHGYLQGEDVRQCLYDSGFQHVKTIQDYGQNDRVSIGQYHVSQ